MDTNEKASLERDKKREEEIFNYIRKNNIILDKDTYEYVKESTNGWYLHHNLCDDSIKGIQKWKDYMDEVDWDEEYDDGIDRWWDLDFAMEFFLDEFIGHFVPVGDGSYYEYGSKSRNERLRDFIAETNEDLKAKNFSEISVSEGFLSQEHDTIDVTINAVNNNPYGASINQARYLDKVDNIIHWESKEGYCWYLWSTIQQCSASAISWLIDFAENHQDIEINFIIKK